MWHSGRHEKIFKKGRRPSAQSPDFAESGGQREGDKEVKLDHDDGDGEDKDDDEDGYHEDGCRGSLHNSILNTS